MAVLIQLGKCGNQIGAEFLDKFFTESLSKVQVRDHAETLTGPSSLFFRLSNLQSRVWIARALAVDTEPRVVQRITNDKSRKWIYHPKNSAFLETGAGNNWAYGYKKHAPKVYEMIESRIHAEADYCAESFQGFVLIHSLAGGTGSGLGAYFTERLRRDFPTATIMTIVVWPFISGEVILQNYNIILTLSRVYLYSNAVLTIFNDTLKKISQERLLQRKSVDIPEMNDVAAFLLSSLFLPCSLMKLDDPKNRERFNGFDGLVKRLCNDPRFKLLQVTFTPMLSEKARAFSTQKLASMIRDMSQIVLTNSQTDERLNWNISATSPRLSHQIDASDRLHRLVSAALFIRGPEIWKGWLMEDPKDKRKKIEVPVPEEALSKSIIEAGWINNAQWNHPRVQISDNVTVFVSSRAVSSFDKLICCISNTTALLEHIRRTRDKARNLYEKGAYVHWYERYGLEIQTFDIAFATMDEIIEAYSAENEE